MMARTMVRTRFSRRLTGLAGAMACVASGLAFAAGAGTDFASPFEEGRALYEGRHPALVATLRGASQTPLPAQQAACVSCHRPSGLGSFEGEAVVPPIASGLLSRPFDPATTRRYGPPGRPGDAGAPRMRPAYDAAALHRLLTEGHAPDGRALGALMPRYAALEPRHSAALLAFLEGLGTQPTPGVDDHVVHFATITSDDVPEAQAQPLVQLLQQFFARKNAQTRGEEQRRAVARRTEHVMYARYRRWELHHWVLRGEPATWPRQLAALYAARPVFAVLSGRSERDWAPVHRFCETERLPCLFPITPWPGEEAGFYTAYFSGGFVAQAQWLAQAAASASTETGPSTPPPAGASSLPRTDAPWLVMGGDTAEARALAERVAGALRSAARAGPVTVDASWRGQPVIVSPLPAAEVARRLAASTPPAGAAPRVILLAGASPPPADAVAWPAGTQVQWVTQQEGGPSPRLARARAWWRGQGLRPADEALAAQVLFAATAAVESLVHVDERFSREYCLEKLEHNLENMPPMTAYPRLSLGPNQRLAAKGAWLAPAR